MKHLVGKDMTKAVPFMGDEVEVRQLSVAQVLKLQGELANANEVDSLETVSKIVKVGVVGADEITDSEMKKFPLAELVELANKVMQYSGLKAEEGND